MEAAQLSISRSISPSVGDLVVLRRDVLAETARHTPGAPIVWRFLEAGTRGTLIGWRDRPQEEPRAVVEVDGEDRRLVVLMGARHVTVA